MVALLEPAPEPGGRGRESEERLVGAAEQETGVADEVQADVRGGAGCCEIAHQGRLELDAALAVRSGGAEGSPDLRNAVEALAPGGASRRQGTLGVDIVGEQQEQGQHDERPKSITDVLTEPGVEQEPGELGGEARLFFDSRRGEAPAQKGERPGRALVEWKGRLGRLGQLRVTGAEGRGDEAARAGQGSDLCGIPPAGLREAANEGRQILEVALLDKRQIANDKKARDDQEPSQRGKWYRRAVDLDLLTLCPQAVEVEWHSDLGAREMPMEIYTESALLEEVHLADQAVGAGQGAVAHGFQRGHGRTAIGPMDEQVDVPRRARGRVAAQQRGQRRALERYGANASIHQDREKGVEFGLRSRHLTMLGQAPPPSCPCARRGRLSVPGNGRRTAPSSRKKTAIGG